MTILIYSDPHLGLSLGAHTTVASRLRLQKKLEEHLLDKVLSQNRADMAICAGDFFHKHQNTEELLSRAWPLAEMTSLILSGNHDVTNDADKVGSLELLRRINPARIEDPWIVPVEFNQPYYESVWFGKGSNPCEICLVPHHSTQALFEQTLENILVDVPTGPRAVRLLVLHCNYNSPFVLEDGSLNLTRAKAGQLLNLFDKIVIGHDHNPKEDFGGRLVVLGNTHPTGFGDLSNKRIMLFDEATGSHSFETIWEVAKGFQEVRYNELAGVRPGVEFLQVTGEVGPEELHEVMQQLRKLWVSREDLFAVRSLVTVKTGDTMANYAKTETLNVRELIEEELKPNEDLYALWKEILAEQHNGGASA